MGLNFRKRIRLGKGAGLNLSKRGISLSQKVGPVTFNSRGRTTVRLGKGLSYTSGGSSDVGCGCLVLLVLMGVLARYFWFLLIALVVGWLIWRAFRKDR